MGPNPSIFPLPFTQVSPYFTQHKGDVDYSSFKQNRIFTYGREAQADVQILARARQEVLVEVLVGGRAAREFLLHDRDQLALDLVHLVTREQVRHLWGYIKVIEVTQWTVATQGIHVILR